MAAAYATGFGVLKFTLVEQVEDLRAELQAKTFRERESPRQGEVRFVEIRPLQRVSSGVAVCAGQRLKESVRIEILIGPAFYKIDPVKFGLMEGRTGLRVSPSLDGL